MTSHNLQDIYMKAMQGGGLNMNIIGDSHSGSVTGNKLTPANTSGHDCKRCGVPDRERHVEDCAQAEIDRLLGLIDDARSRIGVPADPNCPNCGPKRTAYGMSFGPCQCTEPRQVAKWLDKREEDARKRKASEKKLAELMNSIDIGSSTLDSLSETNRWDTASSSQVIKDVNDSLKKFPLQYPPYKGLDFGVDLGVSESTYFSVVVDAKAFKPGDQVTVKLDGQTYQGSVNGQTVTLSPVLKDKDVPSSAFSGSYPKPKSKPNKSNHNASSGAAIKKRNNSHGLPKLP